MSEQDSAAEAAALDAEERLWLEGFGDEPEADEAEWDDALWEEGDGEVTLRAGAWDEDVAASAGSCDASEDPVGPHSEDEDTEDEESPEVDSRGRFELRYTLTHPASRERICSAGDVLSEDAIAGGLVVGGVIHDRTQRYASHYTVEYLMVGCEQPCVAQPSQPHQSVAAGKTINSPSAGARMSQRALGIGADGIDEEELQAAVENCPIGLLLLWVREGAVTRSRVVQLMGRDSGVNMPSRAQLVAQRTATEMELGAARGYLDSLDDATIWHLLREHRATATQWDSSVHQLQPPSPLASVLVEGVRYLHPASAQRTGVVRIPGFFSAKDIGEVHRAALAIGEEAGTCIRADSRWTTRYLNTNGKFRFLCPALLKRIVKLGEVVDSTHFHLTDGRRTDRAPIGPAESQGRAPPGGDNCSAETARSARLAKLTGSNEQLPAVGDDMSASRNHGMVPASLAPRCVEYHTMIGGANGLASCGTDSLFGSSQEVAPVPLRAATKTAHYDQGSVLTVDIMLADTAAFEGGRLSTLEADGECKHHPFEQGDALVFVSHKYHAVTPLLSGKRQVLVVELWQGEERDCPHRCVQHWGPCGFKDGCGDGDGSVEVGDADALAAALASAASAGHY